MPLIDRQHRRHVFVRRGTHRKRRRFLDSASLISRRHRCRSAPGRLRRIRGKCPGFPIRIRGRDWRCARRRADSRSSAAARAQSARRARWWRCPADRRRKSVVATRTFDFADGEIVDAVAHEMARGFARRFNHHVGKMLRRKCARCRALTPASRKKLCMSRQRSRRRTSR